ILRYTSGPYESMGEAERYTELQALRTDQGRSAPGEEVGTLRSTDNENARRAGSPEKRGDHTLRLLAKK
ncbi:MAG: hypothetical protein QXL22_01735, partial [Candidatus Nezhaarchaeales archaeon]